jgi:uncharacterized protein (DUF2147 family)
MHAAAPLHVPQLLAQFAVMNATFFVHSPIAAQPAHDGALAAASAHGAVGAIVGVDAGGAAPGDGVVTVQIPQLLAQFAVMNATFFVHSPIAAQPAHDGALAAASAHGAVGAIVELDAGWAAPGDGVTIPGGRGGPTGPGVGGAAIGVGVITAAVAVSAVDGATVRSPHAVRTCSSTSFAGIVVFQ